MLLARLVQAARRGAKAQMEREVKNVTATYKQVFRVGLLLVSFMLFFFPYEYAVGRTVYLL